MHPDAPTSKEIATSYQQMIEAFEKRAHEKREICGDDCYCKPKKGRPKKVDVKLNNFFGVITVRKN